jgi:hypothetical protein
MKADRRMLDSPVRWFRRLAAPAALPAVSDVDSLEAFGSETRTGVESPAGAVAEKPARRRPRFLSIALIVIVAVAATAFPFVQARLQPITSEESRPGRVMFDTRPFGAEVVIDGQSRGYTPLSIQLAAGQHDAVIRQNGEERAVPLNVGAGAESRQYFEFSNRSAAVEPSVGKLIVSTDPPGARVVIDDKPAGTSPVTVELTPTHHRVVVSNDGATAERSITIESGVVNSMVFSLSKTPVLSAGWLSVSSPFDVQVIEHDELLGTSAAARLMMATGPHDVELVSQSLGYREHRRIQIDAGKTATLRLDAKATLSINARPWADVTIDGNAAGQTPIANATISLGAHQIVFRHPSFGERRQSVVVTANGPNRVGVDMTQ